MIDAMTDPHPVDEIVEEFLGRRRRGEHPTMQEYLQRYPERAGDILELFPAMLVVEGARQQNVPEPDQMDRFGDFRIVRELGRGGMGIVYEAEQESLQRRVALKVLQRHLLESSTQVQRFQREVRAAARLHHTNIVPIFSVGREDGRNYYAMQLINGRSLAQLIDDLRRQREPIAPRRPHKSAAALADTACPDQPAPTVTAHPLALLTAPSSSPGATNALPTSANPDRDPRAYWLETARIGIAVAEALDYAHHQGVLHRDIKPANLLLDDDGQVWILDFGLAKLLPRPGIDDDNPSGPDLTETGDVIGTIRYMAPERFTGAGDECSDVFSLGLTLYELLTLRPAFLATNRMKLIRQLVDTEAPDPRTIDPRIPSDLATIVNKAIQNDPRRRYASAAEFASDLRRFREGRPIRARRTSTIEHCWRWTQRNPVVSGLLGIIIFLIVVSFVAVVHERDQALRNEAAMGQERDRTNATNLALRETAEKLRQTNYAATIQLAEHASQAPGGVFRCKELLESLRPQLGAIDPRGFEWHYLDRLNHPARSILTGHSGSVLHLASSRDRRHFASLAADGSVCLWDPAIGACVREWRAHSNRVTALALNADGSSLASAGHDLGGSSEMAGSVIKLWNSQSGGLIRSIPIGTGVQVMSLQFTRDGRRLIAGCGLQYGSRNNYRPRLTIFSTENGQELLTVPERGFQVALSSDERRMAAWAPDGAIRVLDAANGADLLTLEAQPWLKVVAWSPDDQWLVGGHGQGLIIWDATTGKTLGQAVERNADIQSLSFSPDGRRLAAGSRFDSTVRVHEIPTLREIKRLTGHEDVVTGVQFTPDGESVVSSSVDRTLAVWNLKTAPNPITLEDAGGGTLERIATNSNGRFVAACTLRRQPGTGEIYRETSVRDVASGQVVWSVAEPSCGRIVVTPEGERLVTWSRDGKISLHDLATGRTVSSFVDSTIAQVGEVLASADGAMLVCVGRDRETKVTVRDGHSGAVVREFAMGAKLARQVALSDDGSRLALALV